MTDPVHCDGCDVEITEEELDDYDGLCDECFWDDSWERDANDNRS